MTILLVGVVLLIVQIGIVMLPNDSFSNITLKLFSCLVGLAYMVYCSKLLEV